MAISAKFEADFTQFTPAVAGAEASLKKLETGTKGVESALKLVGNASAASASKFDTLHQGIAQADKTLGAFGVQLGPEINALKELGEVSGKTAKQVGLIGSAGLVAAAAMAGWKLGRLISEFFDLDTKIGNATAKLLGWGDVVAAQAGAKADVLARATKSAGRAITDFGEAMAINTATAKAFRDSLETTEVKTARYKDVLAGLKTAVGAVTSEQAGLILQADALNQSVAEIAKGLKLEEAAVQSVLDKQKAHQDSMQKSADAAKKLADEHAAVAQKMADVEARLQDLKTGTEGISPAIKASILDWRDLGASQADLVIKFGLSAGAIKAVGVEADTAAAKAKAFMEAAFGQIAANIEAQNRLNAAQGVEASSALDVYAAAMTKLHAARVGNITQLPQEIELQNALNKALADAGAAAQAAVLAIGEAADAKRGAKTAADDLARSNRDLATSFQVVVTGIQPTHAQLQAYEAEVRAAYLAAGIIQHDYLLSGPVPRAAGAGFGGGGGGARAILGGGGGGSGSGSVENHIYVNGTAADVARKVAAELTRTLKQSTKL